MKKKKPFSLHLHIPIDSNHGISSEQEKRHSRNESTENNVWLDWKAAQFIAHNAPNGRSDGIGTVFQAEDQTNVEWSQFEATKDLKKQFGDLSTVQYRSQRC